MSWKPFQNLRFRLVVWYSLLAGLSMGISEGFLYFELRRAMLDQVDRALQVSAIQALKNLDDEVDNLEFDPRKDAPILASLLNEAGVEIYLLDPKGALIESIGNSLALADAERLQPGFSTVDTPEGRWRIYLQDVPMRNRRPGGWLKVARSLHPLDSTLADLLRRHLVAVPLLLGMVGLGGFIIASRALTPIAQITEITRRIRQSGDLTQRIGDTYTTDDELTRLALLFDEMLDSLQRTFEQQEQFMADASHELRTPLTTLRGLVQVTLHQPRDQETYAETLHTIELEVERLIRLSSDLLLLSRLEQQSQDLSLEPVDLSDLLAAIALQIQPLADLESLTLSTHIDPDLRIWGSPDHLIRLFINLLDNAVKYTGTDGQIALGATLQADGVHVTVSDTGVGIPTQHLPHLFERFYRVEKSRSRSQGGTGLGLAIAKEIVHRHQGMIAVESELGAGTIVTVTFPRHESRLEGSYLSPR
jgi:heavy metal sensor kinase